MGVGISNLNQENFTEKPDGKFSMCCVCVCFWCKKGKGKTRASVDHAQPFITVWILTYPPLPRSDLGDCVNIFLTGRCRPVARLSANRYPPWTRKRAESTTP